MQDTAACAAREILMTMDMPVRGAGLVPPEPCKSRQGTVLWAPPGQHKSAEAPCRRAFQLPLWRLCLTTHADAPELLAHVAAARAQWPCCPSRNIYRAGVCDVGWAAVQRYRWLMPAAERLLARLSSGSSRPEHRAGPPKTWHAHSYTSRHLCYVPGRDIHITVVVGLPLSQQQGRKDTWGASVRADWPGLVKSPVRYQDAMYS